MNCTFLKSIFHLYFCLVVIICYHFRFNDLCPLACTNFLHLCNGDKGTVTVGESKDIKLHYLNSPLHRCVSGGWIQGGDIVDGSGLNSYAAVGKDGRFRDESFSVDFGGEVGGIIGYSTKEPHGNGSQFFVTLGPMAWMNNKSVGFGRVVQGFPVM